MFDEERRNKDAHQKKTVRQIFKQFLGYQYKKMNQCQRFTVATKNVTTINCIYEAGSSKSMTETF